MNALRPGGVFAGDFFGPKDSWAQNRDMTFHTRDEVGGLLASLNVLLVAERDEGGPSGIGPKHWHVFRTIAQRSI